MDPVLMTLGMLMIASAITLMKGDERTLLVGFAQGLGLQALVGAVVSAAQLALMSRQTEGMSVWERAQLVVQGIPYGAGGFSARTMDEAHVLAHVPHLPNIDTYLALCVAQAFIISVIVMRRLVKQSTMFDPVVIFLAAAITANGAMNLAWPWWQTA